MSPDKIKKFYLNFYKTFYDQTRYSKDLGWGIATYQFKCSFDVAWQNENVIYPPPPKT